MSRELASHVDSLERHLFGIAYRMLGSITEADDVVQETRVRALGAKEEADDPRRYLSTVVTRLSIDRLRALGSRREEYVGPWLPEPLPTRDEESGPEALAESVSMAFLVVLETLDPVERAAFLLREVFGYDYVMVAEIVRTSEVNCRQIVSRARARVRAGRPRFAPSSDKCEELTWRFVDAVRTGDLDGLVALLHADATLWSDGGGRVAAALRPIRGALAIARFCLGLAAKATGSWSVRPTSINGQPGLLNVLDGEVDSVTLAEVEDGRIVGIRIVRNPEKLAGVRRFLAEEDDRGAP